MAKEAKTFRNERKWTINYQNNKFIKFNSNKNKKMMTLAQKLVKTINVQLSFAESTFLFPGNEHKEVNKSFNKKSNDFESK